MKEFWISAVVAAIVVLLGAMWVINVSNDYAEKHPEITAEALKSNEEYNANVDAHNEKIANA